MNWFYDIRYGFRSLARSSGFAAIAILTLAIGIGANTAIFSVIEAVILRPLPFEDPARLVLLSDSSDPENGGFLYKDLAPLKSENRTLEGLAEYYRDSGYSRVTISGSGEPQSVQCAFVPANLFPLLGVPPVLGRVFASDEEQRRDRVVVLSHGLWMNRFGGSPDVLRPTLPLDGSAYQIIGVMPATFHFPAADQQFWVPITTNARWGENMAPGHSSGFYQRWQAIGRLRRGSGAQQAEAELSTIFAAIRQTDADPNRGAGIIVQ